MTKPTGHTRREATPATRAANDAGLRRCRSRIVGISITRRAGSLRRCPMAASSAVRTVGRSGICRGLRSSSRARRRPRRSTRACGGSRSWCSRAGCTRSATGSTRCAPPTSRTSRSSKATPASIVFDPLISVETATGGLELYFQHRPRRPVVAVDPFAQPRRSLRWRARASSMRRTSAAGKVKIIAPGGLPRGGGRGERAGRQRR